jgi:GntR family transcriptional regulator
MVTEAWLPAELADSLTESALLQAPLYDLLADAGVQMDRVRHEFTAEIAGPRNARLLDTAIGAALLRVNRLVFVGGAPHHYLSVLLLPSRSRVLLSQTSAELNGPGSPGSIDGLAFAHDVRREPR